MNNKLREIWKEASGQDECFDEKVIEKFAELIIDKCADTVIDCDPSEKAILHEPYRTIMNSIVEAFEEDIPE